MNKPLRSGDLVLVKGNAGYISAVIADPWGTIYEVTYTDGTKEKVSFINLIRADGEF